MFFPLLVLASISACASAQESLVTDFSWKFFDYVWESERAKIDSVRNGSYFYKSIVPIDVDRAADGRTFLAVTAGSEVPATLCTVSGKQSDSGPLVAPYPDWSWHQGTTCDRIVSATGVTIDECNRLWVLDSGKIDDQFICYAKLLAFDLSTDKLIASQIITPDVASDKYGRGLLYYPVVLTDGDNCENTTVYAADAEGYALVVLSDDGVSRLENKLCKPEPSAIEFSVDEESFNLTLGVMNLAVSPALNNNDERFLFFRPLASNALYAADVVDIAEAADKNSVRYYGHSEVFPSQVSSMVFSSEGVLLYGAVEDIGIGCWRMDMPLKPENFETPLIDRERLQYVAGLKVKQNSETGQEELLILSNRLQKVYRNTLNFEENNFYVLRVPIDSIINNTVCDPNLNLIV